MGIRFNDIRRRFRSSPCLQILTDRIDDFVARDVGVTLLIIRLLGESFDEEIQFL